MDFSPAVVIEAEDACAGSPKAEGWVRESMRGSVAPRGVWTVRVSSPSPSHVLGVLEDEQGRPVAHRDLYLKNPHECEGTMHAVGVWASLVLDTEIDRAKQREREREVAAKEDADKLVARRAADADSSSVAALQKRDGSSEDADAGAPNKKLPSRIEIGASTDLVSGLGGPTATYLGVSAYVFVEAGFGLFLRPSASYAHSLGDMPINWGSGRLDFCARVPGNYQDRKGLQLDVCFGPEAGAMSLKGSTGDNRVRPLFGFGPTMSLRGDLVSAFGVVVRVATAYNIVHGEELDPIAPVSVRGEVGVSWGVR